MSSRVSALALPRDHLFLKKRGQRGDAVWHQFSVSEL